MHAVPSANESNLPQYHYTGNPTVDGITRLKLTGNIIPDTWYQHPSLKKDNGNCELMAMLLLAEIIGWYKARQVVDEETLQVVGWQKKFKNEKLQVFLHAYASKFSCSKDTIARHLKFLHDRKLIVREYHAEYTFPDGKTYNNVIFVEPVLAEIRKISAVFIPPKYLEFEENPSEGVPQDCRGGAAEMQEGYCKNAEGVPQKCSTGAASLRTNNNNNTQGHTQQQNPSSSLRSPADFAERSEGDQRISESPNDTTWVNQGTQNLGDEAIQTPTVEEPTDKPAKRAKVILPENYLGYIQERKGKKVEFEKSSRFSLGEIESVRLAYPLKKEKTLSLVATDNALKKIDEGDFRPDWLPADQQWPPENPVEWLKSRVEAWANSPMGKERRGTQFMTHCVNWMNNEHFYDPNETWELRNTHANKSGIDSSGFDRSGNYRGPIRPNDNPEFRARAEADAKRAEELPPLECEFDE
jgi:hypothetical protein